jgi:FKBP-type peptidyl-prolyl cis-trans isomerase 2
MAEPKPSIVLPVLLIVVVVVGAGVGFGFLYEANDHSPPAGPWTVAVGSNVTVNYIGKFGSGAQLGDVFDTSIYSVAVNNASYPKSLEFSYRGSAANYTPLGVSVGPAVPGSGYTIDNITFGSVVPGFWQGLLGLEVGQTRTVSFGPGLGYGAPNPSCYASQPLVFTTPTFRTLTSSSFSTLYPGVNATAGTQFADPTYGWNDLVFSVNSSAIVVQMLTHVGWVVPAASWPIAVVGVNSSVVTLKNELSYADVGSVLGHVSGSGICGTTSFIVSALNMSSGTYVQDFNREVVGQTLTFVVTIVARY